MSKNDKNWKNKVHAEEVEFDFNVIKEGVQIPVSEVIIGDEIVSAWSRSGVIIKTVWVTERVPCPGGNGLHVHLNRSNCHDSRSMVWVR